MRRRKKAALLTVFSTASHRQVAAVVCRRRRDVDLNVVTSASSARWSDEDGRYFTPTVDRLRRQQTNYDQEVAGIWNVVRMALSAKLESRSVKLHKSKYRLVMITNCVSTAKNFVNVPTSSDAVMV